MVCTCLRYELKGIVRNTSTQLMVIQLLVEVVFTHVTRVGVLNFHCPPSRLPPSFSTLLQDVLRRLTNPALKKLYRFVLKRLVGRFLDDDIALEVWHCPIIGVRVGPGSECQGLQCGKHDVFMRRPRIKCSIEFIVPIYMQ